LWGKVQERIIDLGVFMSCSLETIIIDVHLLLLVVLPGTAFTKSVNDVTNPHGNPLLCDVCHVSGPGERKQDEAYALQFGGRISALCISCHNGKHAIREIHPVDVIPSSALSSHIPSEFPLKAGQLTCLTCHDLRWHCQIDTSGAQPQSCFLRGAQPTNRLAFCFLCHREDSYQRHNVHNQLEAGEIKTDTCLWCHSRVPDVQAAQSGEVDPVSISQSSEVCRSCHIVARQHPSEGVHVLAKPSPEMIWRMSAYELQSRMRLPMDRLQKYVRAANRKPQSILLDEQGRLQCISCHNPHEQGLLSDRNPRALGAEPIRATNHRLRGHRGRMCLACHEK
jgi:hypothetical protein